MKKRINCKKVAIESRLLKTKLDMKTRYDSLTKYNSKLT